MALLLLCLWAASDGFGDALYYARLGADSLPWNEHGALVLRRALALLAMWCAAAEAMIAAHHLGPGWLAMAPAAATLAAGVLAFSLFHNEAYNFARLLIAEQTVGRAWARFRFNYQSATTTARFDFDGPSRWWLAAAGLLLYLGAATGLFILAT